MCVCAWISGGGALSAGFVAAAALVAIARRLWPATKRGEARRSIRHPRAGEAIWNDIGVFCVVFQQMTVACKDRVESVNVRRMPDCCMFYPKSVVAITGFAFLIVCGRVEVVGHLRSHRGDMFSNNMGKLANHMSELLIRYSGKLQNNTAWQSFVPAFQAGAPIWAQKNYEKMSRKLHRKA